MSGKCTVVDTTMEEVHGRPETGTTRRAFGEHFEILIAEFAAGSSSDVLEQHQGKVGEEVAAVLEGRFEVVAGDENHQLSMGEAIIIPPGVDRSWRCLDETGSLYRAITIVPHPF